MGCKLANTEGVSLRLHTIYWRPSAEYIVSTWEWRLLQSSQHPRSWCIELQFIFSAVVLLPLIGVYKGFYFQFVLNGHFRDEMTTFIISNDKCSHFVTKITQFIEMHFYSLPNVVFISESNRCGSNPCKRHPTSCTSSGAREATGEQYRLILSNFTLSIFLTTALESLGGIECLCDAPSERRTWRLLYLYTVRHLIGEESQRWTTRESQ